MSERDRIDQAQYLFDPENIREAGRPPEDSARLVWILLTLIRRRSVPYATYAKEFARTDRTFRRDLAILRELGERYGFSISRLRAGVARLDLFDEPRDERRRVETAAVDTFAALVDALGEIVGNDVAPYVDLDSAPLDPFLRLALPRLVAASEVARTYVTVRRAWTADAKIRFRYRSTRSRPGDAPAERTVEPHLVTYYDGRYYLVAYDRAPQTRAWRQFALDRILGPIAHAGTFERRPVPPSYRGLDAIGLFKSGRASEVTIALSPRIAEAVVARRWQRGQSVEVGSTGETLIRFDVHDLGEAVRWALGFGGEARIVSPPEAVAIARELARSIFDAHLSRSDRARSGTG